MLTPIIGLGNFNAEINADIDFTRTEQTNETYDPRMNAMRSQQETVQESTDGRERLTQLMQEAIGFVAERGDKVTLVSSTFADEQKFDTRTWYDAPWLEDAIKQLVIVLILGIVVMGALRPFLNRLLDRSMASSIAMDQPVVGEGESIEVREGESLEEIKARLKPKKAAISAELLDTANTYDDKVTLIRMLVGDDAARVTAVLKQFIQRDLA
ncbi:MAG: hypothetical protein EBY21_10100 [Alphaproteobacteria bacterium]|nr:hypothetical protein [Alphaproteobacteria bacterium]